MRQLIVTNHHSKNFRITIPDDAQVKFSHLVPDTSLKGTRGYDPQMPLTLSVYNKDGGLIASFTHIESFRELSLNYSEEVVREEGASIWKSDQNGYERTDNLNRTRAWNGEEPKRIIKTVGKR